MVIKIYLNRRFLFKVSDKAVITSGLISLLSGIVTYLIQEIKIQVEKEKLIHNLHLNKRKSMNNLKLKEELMLRFQSYLTMLSFKGCRLNT